MTKTVYFCAGWFNDKQNKSYNQAMKAIENNGTIDRTNSYVPLEHQYNNLAVKDHPELLHDKEWAMGTYNGDRVGVSTTDVCLAVYLPSEEDVGCGIELGMAKALGKYVLVVIPDEEWGKPINLMTFGIADNFIKMSDLRDFNFNQPTFGFYDGAVY